VCSNGVGSSGGRTSPDLSPVLPHGISDREFNHAIVSGCRFEIPEFDPAKPIYGKDDDIFEEKERKNYYSGEVQRLTIMRCYRSAVSPERAEEICGEVLRTYSLTKAQLHQAQLFHGSTSAALLAFTEYNDCSGSLIPLGLLEAKRKVPFAGEVCFGRKNVNAKNLSTTWIEGLKDALWYSSRLTKWSTTMGNKAVTRLEDLCKKIYQNNPKTMICEKLKIALQSGNFDSFERALELETYIPEFCDMNSLIIDAKRLKEWDKLNAFEKKLIEEPFSVLFGIKSDRKDVYSLVDSSIYSEIGLFGGAIRDEIKVIFVPADKVDIVKNLLLNKGFNKIAVEVLPKKTI